MPARVPQSRTRDHDHHSRKGLLAAPAPSFPSSSSSTSSTSSHGKDDSDERIDSAGMEAKTDAVRSEKSRGKQRVKEDDHTSDDDDESSNRTSSDQSEDEGPAVDLDKIRKRMHHALRHLSSAAKRARHFEVQRIVKRIKSCHEAQKPSLEAQLTSLKSLNLKKIAAVSLLGKLSKAKLLPRGASSKDFKSEEAQAEQKGMDAYPLLAGVWAEGDFRRVWTEAGPANDLTSDLEKVKAKLLSNKSLAEESGRMVQILGKLAGRVRPITSDVDILPVQQDQKEEVPVLPSMGQSDRIWSGSEGEDDDELDVGEEGSSASEEEDDSGDLDEEAIQAQIATLGDLDKWDALVAQGSSDDQSEDDTEDDDDIDVKESVIEQAPSVKRKRSSSPRINASATTRATAKAHKRTEASSSDDEDDEVDGSEEESDLSSYDSNEDSDASPSRLLPSLSHGFLARSHRRHGDDDFSGSEGSYDGHDDGPIEENPEDKASKAKGVKASKERKNRMGQRARKALWEKKFGRNANHLKLQEKESRVKRVRTDGDVATPNKGGPQSYKPLRRGRDGKPLPTFEAPKQTDSGWKKFPMSAQQPSESIHQADGDVGQSRRSAAETDVSSRAPLPPQRGGHVPPFISSSSSSSLRGSKAATGRAGAGGSAPPLRFQTQPKQQAEQEMHPSWLAKQKQKEREDTIARSLAAGAGMGKKVTFD